MIDLALFIVEHRDGVELFFLEVIVNANKLFNSFFADDLQGTVVHPTDSVHLLVHWNIRVVLEPMLWNDDRFLFAFHIFDDQRPVFISEIEHSRHIRRHLIHQSCVRSQANIEGINLLE